LKHIHPHPNPLPLAGEGNILDSHRSQVAPPGEITLFITLSMKSLKDNPILSYLEITIPPYCPCPVGKSWVFSLVDYFTKARLNHGT